MDRKYKMEQKGRNNISCGGVFFFFLEVTFVSHLIPPLYVTYYCTHLKSEKLRLREVKQLTQVPSAMSKRTKIIIHRP